MEKPPFQFGLKAVFAAVTVAAVLLAVFHYMPLSVLAYLLSNLLVVLFLSSSLFMAFAIWVRFCLWIIERREPPDA